MPIKLICIAICTLWFPGLSHHYYTVALQKTGKERIYGSTVASSLKVEITNKYILIGQRRYYIYLSSTSHNPDQYLFLCIDSAKRDCSISFIPHQWGESLEFNMVMEMEYSSPKPIGNKMMKLSMDSAFRYFLVKKFK